MSDAAPAAGTAGSETSSSSAQETDQTDTATGEGAKAEAKAPSINFKGTKHKYTAAGKEVEVDYDELLRRAAHADGSHERLRKATELEKTAKAEAEQAKDERAALKAIESGDWGPLIKRIGLEKAEELSEQLLGSKLEWEALTDEQKEARRLKHENAQYKARDEAAKKEADDKAAADAEEAAAEEIDKEIGAAVAELSALGKKPTPRYVARIAEILIAQLEGGATKSPKEAIALVDGELEQDVLEILPALPPEKLRAAFSFMAKMPAKELRAVLPKPVLDALRNADVDDVLAQDHRSGAQTSSEREESPKARKALSQDDWFAEQEKRLGRKR